VLSATAIGQKWKDRWKRAANAAMTTVALSAVTVAALALLGTELLAAWKAPGSAEQALASGSVFEELVNFEAPAWTVARVKAQLEEADQSMRRGREAALLVRNWRFTQNPIADLMQLVLQQELNQVQALLAAASNLVSQIQQIIATDSAIVGSIINSFVTAVQNLVSSILNSIFNSATVINVSNNSSSSSSSSSASPFK
jgi:hypothetical protein